MNKLTAFLIAIFVMSQSVYVGANTTRIEARIAAFSPSSQFMRDIYGKWLVDYQVEAGTLIYRNYELWGNLSYVFTDGHTRVLHTKTDFTNWNVSGGFNYIMRMDYSTALYLGLGINGAFVKVFNDSSFVEQNVRKRGVGGVFKFGAYFRPCKNLICEVFTDYLYQTINLEKKNQIGGFKLGAGAGLVF